MSVNIRQTVKNIVRSQMPDKGWLTDGQRPQYNEVSGKGFFIRSLWSQFNCLELQDNIVVRRFDDPDWNVGNLQTVISMSERKPVLKYCHEKSYAGYLGTHQTLNKIRQSFYWPGLQSDVRAYVAGCNQCTRRRRPMKSASMRLEEKNGGHESKRPTWMADCEIE
ncbi:Hypothetical predicted protein [Mytilus galloprovincialis]|uniref:Integrase zinc-binding domain-containing protein n=1 Tax=Mytilus galloprovincialis TaxID=29158 RepID=A0A8B6G8G3_MYTGA|nr:Hypothetical predicted protein [Mytilus galloprovincialis]